MLHCRAEKEVGEAIKASGIPRQELFITSKLSAATYSKEGMR